MNKIVRIENLVKKYDDKTTAIDGITLDVEEGTIVSIIGRSGSGKSTLLQMIGLLDQPTSGIIYIDNQNCSHFNSVKRASYRRNKIGFIYQNYNLIPEYSIRDNICLPLILGKKKIDEEYFNELVELLGITNLLTKQPFQLSGGEQQRVAIARAFIIKPMLILADEPTGNLDKANGDRVMNLMLSTARKYNTTILFVTHDEPLSRCADKLINMGDGKIAMS